MWRIFMKPTYHHQNDAKHFWKPMSFIYTFFCDTQDNTMLFLFLVSDGGNKLILFFIVLGFHANWHFLFS